MADPQTLRCASCTVQTSSVCSGLSKQERTQLSRMGRTRHFAAGETILIDDAPASLFGNIVSGVVKLSKCSGDGRQQIVGLLFEADFLGRTFAARNPYHAQAATAVTMCTFAVAPFQNFLASHPGLEHRLLENTLDELDAAREWMFVLGRQSAFEKVACFLSMVTQRPGLAPCAHAGTTECFELPLTRGEIADFLGLTIETVSRQLTKMKKDGFIELHGSRGLQIKCREALQEHVGAAA